MFALFFNLYYAMFTGTWTNNNLTTVNSLFVGPMRKIINIITSIFNQSTAIEDMSFTLNETLILTSTILALITTIGIVVMAVKGIKRVFSIFFMGIRR